MSHEVYISKFKIFYIEALRDIRLGVFNKAISALWFSLEALLRGLLLKENKTPPERSGKLISIAVNLLFNDVEEVFHLSRLLTALYFRRREIDHRKKIADKSHAEDSLKKYRRIISIIAKKFPWIKEQLDISL